MNVPHAMRVFASALIIQDGMVLLVEYSNEKGSLHYRLPRGLVQPHESIREAVAREVRDATCLNVEVGRLVIAYEQVVRREPIPRETPPALTLIFDCQLVDGSARLPDCSDPAQTGVRWLGLDELDEIPLSPPIYKPILDYAYHGSAGVAWIEV